MSSLNPGLNWRRNSFRNSISAGIPEEDLADDTPRTRSRKQRSSVDTDMQAMEDNDAIDMPMVPLEGMPEDIDPDAQLEAQRKTNKVSAKNSRMQQDTVTTITAMLNNARGEAETLQVFMHWVTRSEEARWRDLWSRFRPDGTMTWPEFERFAHWEWKWTGPVEAVFSLIEEFNDEGERCGFLTNTRLLELKKWYNSRNDMGMREADIGMFRKRLTDRYGNMGRAWRLALDKYDRGHCCYLHFCRVCHDVGPVRSIKTIWCELTSGDVTRPLYFRDLDPEGDTVLHQFAQSLVLRSGTLLKGYQQMIANGGGNLHRDSFLEQCSEFGINMGPAKWLYSVLDPWGTRYLTEWDETLIAFLSQYDPGPLPVNAIDAVVPRNIIGEGTVMKPFVIKSRIKQDDAHNAFDLEVELTPEEFQTYQHKLRSRQKISGIDVVREEAMEIERRRVQTEVKAATTAKQNNSGGFKKNPEALPWQDTDFSVGWLAQSKADKKNRR